MKLKNLEIIKDAAKIPNEIVRRGFEMNSDIEVIIRGEELQEGMVILLEEALMRENPSYHLDSNPHICDDYRCPRIKETSQWCMVTNLKRRGDITSFVGVYADGVHRSRTYNESFFWLVKIDSMLVERNA